VGAAFDGECQGTGSPPCRKQEVLIIGAMHPGNAFGPEIQRGVKVWHMVLRGRRDCEAVSTQRRWHRVPFLATKLGQSVLLCMSNRTSRAHDARSMCPAIHRLLIHSLLPLHSIAADSQGWRRMRNPTSSGSAIWSLAGLSSPPFDLRITQKPGVAATARCDKGAWHRLAETHSLPHFACRMGHLDTV
jgi:hypothetical protein